MLTLEDQLSKTLEAMASINVVSPRRDNLIHTIDLTVLDEQATPHAITELAAKACKYQVAAICILPQHLPYISPSVTVKRATVANFPTGNLPQKEILQAIEQTATNHLVDEMDYVFPYQVYLDGQPQKALADCREVYQLCKQQKLTFKVILETGALPSIEVIHRLSLELINIGCDFLKTSTGKITTGVTVPAAFAMLTAIIESNSSCGIKLSGGIKTIEQALIYSELAEHLLGKKIDKSWFRLGASSLLDDILASSLRVT